MNVLFRAQNQSGAHIEIPDSVFEADWYSKNVTIAPYSGKADTGNAVIIVEQDNIAH